MRSETTSDDAKEDSSETPTWLPPQTRLPMVVSERKPRLLQSLWAHRWFFLVATLALGASSALLIRAVLGPSVVVDQVRHGPLVETVVASGHVETPYRAEIGSQITGTVQDVPVEEGEHVHKGQHLITIESSELKAALSQAQSLVAQDEAHLRQLRELTLPAGREAVTQAKATLVAAQKTFDRAKELAEKGFGTRAALDDSRKNLDVAQTQVRTAELQVQSVAPGGSDYVIAVSELAQARANLDTARSRLAYTTISAPRDGVLIARSVERGDVVAPGKVLLMLAPEGETQLVLEIDERNLGKINLGENALASADAYPDKRFPAVISYINPGVDINRASVEVKLTVPNPPTYLRQDMTVSVDIEVGRQDNALVLPARSVRDLVSNTPWVMSIRHRRAYRQPVTVGLHGQSQVQITDGVTEGTLAVPVASGVRTGQHLRPIVQ